MEYMLNVTAAHWNNICYWGDSAIVWLRHLDCRQTMGLFSSTGQPHKRCALRWTMLSRQAEGREWSGGDRSGVEGTGVEWRGGEGRGGEGRAGQGRVPDCLGGLSRVGISSRSTRPWNGQPPSRYKGRRHWDYVLATDRTKWASALKQHFKTMEDQLVTAAADKQVRRKVDGSSIRPETTHICVICNKDCHSHFGIFIHKRRCNNPARI